MEVQVDQTTWVEEEIASTSWGERTCLDTSWASESVEGDSPRGETRLGGGGGAKRRVERIDEWSGAKRRVFAKRRVVKREIRIRAFES